jgi:ubiquinone/menaquinone biosynthesis C-methylase UbiE
MLHAHPAADTRGHLGGHWPLFYDTFVKAMLLGGEGRLRTWTADQAGMRPGESVLDAGCGTGSLTLVARRRAGPQARVCGVDAAPEMVAVAQRKARQAGLDVDFRAGLIQALPFGDGEFDLVLSSLMMHHVPSDLQPRAFAELRRVLKPDGRLLVVDFQRPSSPIAAHLTVLLLGPHMAHNDVGALAPLARAAGFAAVEIGPSRQWPPVACLRARAGREG